VASKAGLSLHRPFQRPKRIVETSRPATPRPAKDLLFRAWGVWKPFLKKWIPKASLWRSLRQSLNLACFLCLALPNRGRRVRDLAGTQRSLRRLRRGLGRIDCRAWFFDDGNVRYNNDSGGQCGELAGSGSAGARVVWRWQNAGEREGCVWQGRGRFGRARQAYTGCCVWRGCGAAAGVAQTGGGAA